MEVKVRQGVKTAKLLHEKASPAQKKKSASREGRRASQNGAEAQGGNAAARRLLRKWLVDDSGYEEDTWPLLKHALQENRSSPQRKLFRV